MSETDSTAVIQKRAQDSVISIRDIIVKYFSIEVWEFMILITFFFTGTTNSTMDI